MISVIVVTYNAVETLQKCLDSIYEQNYPLLDIIVIDGQSTDGTVDIIQKNAAKIKYAISEKDEGIYDAMNKALFQINTPWVYFLGADDILLPDFSKLIAELTDPHAIYYANVIYKGRKCVGQISAYRQAKSGIFHQSIIYPSSIFKKYKYNTRYKIAADYALNMQLYKDKAYTFTYKDYVISAYNDTGISALQKDINFEKDKNYLILKNFGISIWFRYIFRRLKSSFKKTNNG
ncbi:glycosyltransferase [Pedobacter sp.]|uniref:glycosyltransferase n=1 Tax=Pedobacter sp. TaxID=1411316 RepID=UPI003D7F51B6